MGHDILKEAKKESGWEKRGQKEAESQSRGSRAIAAWNKLSIEAMRGKAYGE